MCVRALIRVYMCVYLFEFVDVCVCVYVCISLCVYVYVCASVHFFVWGSTSSSSSSSSYSTHNVGEVVSATHWSQLMVCVSMYVRVYLVACRFVVMCTSVCAQLNVCVY